MTMLDRMRRHKGWLKWSLAIVVLAFILLYIPSFLQTRRPAPATAARSSPPWTAARSPSTASGASTSSRCSPTGQPYGANVDERMLKQLGIDQRIVQQMIEEETALAEASRLGITATRRGSARAHRGAAGAPGERAVHRRGALSPAAADAESADAARRIRGTGPPRRHRREAPGRADQLDHGEPTRKSTRSTGAATRRSSSRSCRSPPTSSARDSTATDAELNAYFEAHKNELQDPREAEGQVRADRHAGDRANGSRSRREDIQRSYKDNSSSTRRRSRCAPATSCSRPRAKTTPR